MDANIRYSQAEDVLVVALKPKNCVMLNDALIEGITTRVHVWGRPPGLWGWIKLWWRTVRPALRSFDEDSYGVAFMQETGTKGETDNFPDNSLISPL